MIDSQRGGRTTWQQIIWHRTIWQKDSKNRQFGTKKANGQFGTKIVQNGQFGTKKANGQFDTKIVKTDNLAQGQFGTNIIYWTIWHRNFLG